MGKRYARSAPVAVRPDWRKRLGWVLCAVGAGLFPAGYLGAVAGVNVLPFDRHHVLT